MFDSTHADVAELLGLAQHLAHLAVGADDAERVDQLEALERLKSAASAAQARVAERLGSEQAPAPSRAAAAARDRSHAVQLGLARHESPHRGRRLLGLARALVHDLPETFAALQRGDINEQRALLVASGSGDLTRQDRVALDGHLAAHLPALGDREVQLATTRLVMRLDPEGAVLRRRRAHARRHVASRLLPDGMAMITAVVSDVHHAAIMGSLHARAAAEVAAGERAGEPETRSRGQALADLVVARLTGQVTATAVPVRIDLVVSAETLLGGEDEPAQLVVPGLTPTPIPGSVARTLVLASPVQQTRLRRLFRFEDTDRLVAMDSTSRTFDGLLAEIIRLRDQLCRTRWCNAPIRHSDHVEPAAHDGPTSESNGQGLCVDCNLAKESTGWHHTALGDVTDPHEVTVSTPTGHRHLTRSPGLLGRPPRPGTRFETYLSDFALAV